MRALIRRIGRRGSYLLFLFLLDVLYALSLAKPPADARLSPSVLYIAQVLPLGVWAGIWLAVGLICGVGAFSRKDQWAFACAMGLKVLWGGTFLLGWLVVHLERGWVSAVIWLAFAAFTLLIASWPEDTHIKIRERP